MRLRVGILYLGLAGALLGGCTGWFSQDDHPVLMIDNQSSETVDGFMVGEGFPEARIVKELAPGQQYPYDRLPTTTCATAHLLARDSQGREVDRSDPPICSPSVWIIAARTPSP